ncbi:MAG: MoxR family ATPase [Saprospiraceae bacterium]|nr:MoxR family ATPase [Saprospiraceae bacterium]MDW8228816.1 MoxR family ATPase [Saprospiraceae bacterium]
MHYEEEPPFADNDSPAGLDVSPVYACATRVQEAIQQVIVGQQEAIEQMLIALFTGGHVLIEGVPGIAKTLMARLLARTVAAGFSRIQFTPDLMPADVLGTPVFNLKTSEFHFKPGPIFSNIVLIDEINRAPAKTQSALFEVMEERQASIDGHTYPMASPFMVVATQNPIEQEGTYRLPEAQLDRFLFRILLEYPNLEEEKAILRRFHDDFEGRAAQSVQAVITPQDIATCRQRIEQTHISEDLLDYIATLVHQTRHHPDLSLGASPRASLAITRSAKALAAMTGRNFVTPDDIRAVTVPVLNHRILLTPEREMEGYRIQQVIEDIIRSVPVPR